MTNGESSLMSGLQLFDTFVNTTMIHGFTSVYFNSGVFGYAIQMIIVISMALGIVSIFGLWKLGGIKRAAQSQKPEKPLQPTKH